MTIDLEECKGCGLCVESCPPKCLYLAPELSHTACIRRTTRGATAPVAGFASIAARNPAPSPFTAWRPAESCRGQRQGGSHAQLCKGNVAIVKGAVLAGCRAYYGYPITPASEIAEYAALYIPQVGGTFLQAESEVSAINMVYGAASAGERVMTHLPVRDSA